MNVVEALSNTSKGQLKYDRYWAQEGRTKEVLDSISQYSTKVKINLSPKVLSQVIKPINHKEENDVQCEVIFSKPSPKKVDSKDTDSYYYELQTEAELPLLEYEEDRLKYLEDTFNAKKSEFESYSKTLEDQTEQQYKLLKRNNELDAKKRASDLKKIEDAIAAEAKEKERQLQQHSQTQAKRLSAIVQEAELKQKKAEEEQKRKEQEQQELTLQLQTCKQEVENLVLKAQQKLSSFEYKSYLKVPIENRMGQMSQFQNEINAISGIEFESLAIENVSNAYLIVKKLYEFSQDVSYDIELAKVAALQDHEKQLLQTKFPVLTEEVNKLASIESAVLNKPPEAAPETQIAVSEKSKSKISKDAKAVLSAFIAPDAVDEYYNITENLKSVKDCFQSFVEDPKNKKVRFELQKSINMPINAISSTSGSHVRDKISRLLSILGNKAPSKDMTSDYVVYNFCADLIARKFVEQCDKQISAQHSTAFPIALAVVGVWIRKPEIGNLILGHFYKNCPYLVPFYPPKKENMSEREFHESLGYYFDKEGNIEASYKFLNRMSGFMRLYAAIIISPVPPSSIKYSHPHGIAYAWKWLSRILNMDPRPDITATLLYDFLEVTGHMLQTTYDKQFKKILHIICKDFFPKVKRVTAVGSSGPVERLESFLQQTVKKGFIPLPEGKLDSNFWTR